VQLNEGRVADALDEDFSGVVLLAQGWGSKRSRQESKKQERKRQERKKKGGIKLFRLQKWPPCGFDAT
jgi:hypothetical protein